MKYRRITTALLALAAAVAAVAFTVPAAGAATGHQERRCQKATYVWSTGTNLGTGPHRYVQGHWTSNPGQCQTIQFRITCVTAVTRQVYHVDSGVVRKVGLNDKASCGLDDGGLSAAVRFNGGSWHTLCAPCAGWRPVARQP